MGSIELKMSILTGAVAGLLLIVAELVMMHRKVSKYRDHLRGLRRSGRNLRLFAEVAGFAVIALIQPGLVSILTARALGSFNPAFSANAAQQLQMDGQMQERPLRSTEHMH